jgi:hypothetical protein
MMHTKERDYHFVFPGWGRVKITHGDWGTNTFDLDSLEAEIKRVNHMSNMGQISLMTAADRVYVLNSAIDLLEGHG